MVSGFRVEGGLGFRVNIRRVEIGVKGEFRLQV